MGALQLTYEPKFKIVHRTGELMRSHEAKVVQLWLSVDPLAEVQPNKTPYHFCSNNPINRIDPDGRWDIEVHAFKNRGKSGYAVMIMRDNSGNEVYRTVVKTIGTGGRTRNVRNSDTPQGKYNILGWRKTGEGTGYNSVSFGPNDLLALDYKGSEGGSRNGMHVHGGRQEGKYKGRKDLASTHGCMRINDEDIKAMKEIATNLQANDKTEKPGVLNLTDDLLSPVSYDGNRHSAGSSQFPTSNQNSTNPQEKLYQELEVLKNSRAYSPEYIQQRTNEINQELKKTNGN